MSIQKIFDLIEQENIRQNNGIELIASENYPSKEVRQAQGSILTCKYAEGYAGKRYYGGCKVIDEIETLAISEACKLFDCKFANVQPHSGSQANNAAYRALEVYLTEDLHKLDGSRKMRVLSMNLNNGGHLTHGSPVNFSAKTYDFDFFDLDENGKMDFDIIEQKIKEFKPDLLLTGCSAYPYEIDFARFGELAKKYDILLIVDIAHIAGLVVTGEHCSPFPYADIVTTTTHKTLRGPRGGLILTNNETLLGRINSAIFPYSQGGPLEHVIAAKAICFMEAQKPEFKEYAKKVKENTKAFADRMKELGADCTTSETHLMLLNTKTSFGMTGIAAQDKLEELGITANKNMMNNDTEKPFITSGLRIGFPAITTRGCTKEMAISLADIIYEILSSENLTEEKISEIKNKTKLITSKLINIEKLSF